MMEIQEDLQRVEQWMENKLVLNLTKTKCMLFGTKQKLAMALLRSSFMAVTSIGLQISAT